MTDTRGSVFVSDAPDSRLPSTSPAAPVAPVSIGDVIQAHARLAYQDFAGAPQQAEIDAYGPIVTALSDQRPTSRYVQIGGGMPVNTDAVWQDVAARRLTDPQFLKDVPAEDAADFSAYVKSHELQRRHDAQDVVSRQHGLAQNAAGFATDIGVGLADPINLSAMILTAGGGGAVNTLARGMAREALVNGAIGVAQLPTEAQNRASYGEAMSPLDMAESVGMAALTGAAFHGGVHVLGAAGSAIKARLANASDVAVADHFEQAVPPDQRTPDEQAAVHVMGRETDIDAVNPYVSSPAGRQAHADNLGTAISDILARGNPDVVPPAVPRGISAVPISAAPDLSPGRVIRFVMGDLEGGARVVHYGDVDGGTTKYGIAAKANPGVEVANLSADQAADIAHRKYWLPEYDRADPRTAAVAFDAGYIAGPDVGRRILRESAGDPGRALELYRGYLDHLAETNPAKAKYRVGWDNRIDKLERFVGGSTDRATLRPEGFPDGDALDLAQHDLDQVDMDQQMLDQETRLTSADAPIVPADATSLPPVMEGSGIVDAPSNVTADGASPIQSPQPTTADAQPMAGAWSPSIVAPDVVTVRPETRVAVRDYVAERGNSLARDKVAAALGIEPAEAHAALQMLAARADGTILQRANGSFTRRAVRRAPVDLNRFLSDMGGIRDTEGHDLVGGRNLQKFVPASGMLIRKGGMTLDRAREAAAEAGYFHDHGSPDHAIANTTTADFLDLLEHAHSTRHFALADLGEADRLAESKAFADERRRISDIIDARLGEQGFDFDRSQMRRAAELVQQDGFTHEQAIARVIDEELDDALHEGYLETEKDHYDYLAEQIDRVSRGEGRGAAPDDDGYGLDPRDPGQSQADVDEYRSAADSRYSDDREANGLVGPPPLHDPNIERFSDPQGDGVRSVVDSLEHDLRATVDQSAAGDEALGPAAYLGFLPHEGPPGVSLVDEEGHFVNAVYRDPDGRAQAVVHMATSDEGRAISKEVSTYVRPEFRRKGIATSLYDALRNAGHDVDSVSGTGDLTPDGAAFVSARRRGTADRDIKIDPAIAERERQRAQLKADAPMRARADQDSTIGSPLFDAVDQQQFRLDDEGGERPAANILKEIDADEAAIKAAKDCL